jgi:hypothetical protein
MPIAKRQNDMINSKTIITHINGWILLITSPPIPPLLAEYLKKNSYEIITAISCVNVPNNNPNPDFNTETPP